MRRASEGATKLERQRAPASSPEARINQMAAMAEALSEKRMREGTATSQEILYWLKAASPREKLEQEKLRSDIGLQKAKKEGLESSARIEELYSEAMKAVKSYRGERVDYDD